MMRLMLAVLLLGACSILPEPKPVRYRFVVLEAIGAADPAPPGAAVSTVALRSVEMPSYLDSDELVSRSDANEIRYSRDERWGEPLVAAVPRVLGLDVSARLAADDVELLPQGSLADTWVDVTIQRFGPGTAGRAELHARWTVHARVQGAAVRAGEVRIVDEQGGPAAAGMSRLLGKLGDAIATDVHRQRVATRSP